MAKGIVDELEVVDIDHHDEGRFAFNAQAAALRVFGELAAVIEIGERVGRNLLFHRENVEHDHKQRARIGENGNARDKDHLS